MDWLAARILPSRMVTQDQAEIFGQLSVQFVDESDRAVALLAAAYLDDLLMQRLDKELQIDNEGERDDIFKGPSAPMSTFSARTMMAYALRLITKEERSDLNLIRKIRNAYAHQLLGLNFDTDEIASRCRSLKGAAIGGMPETNRESFIKASVRLMVELIIDAKGNHVN